MMSKSRLIGRGVGNSVGKVVAVLGAVLLAASLYFDLTTPINQFNIPTLVLMPTVSASIIIVGFFVGRW